MWSLLLLLLKLSTGPATIDLVIEGAGTPDAALVVRIRNPAGHRPVAFLREFWKFPSVECTLKRGGQPLPPAFALKPDRPTLAQVVVLEPRAEYSERLGLSYVWGPGALAPGAYHAECHVGARAALDALYEASIRGGAKRATPGLLQDLKRADFALADVRPAEVDFTLR